MSTVIKKSINIIGMHCTACAMNIDFELEDLDGVVSVSTNYARQVTEVIFDEARTNIKEIIATIKKTGYTAIVSS